MTDRAEPVTLHDRIRAEIEDRILTGAWKPGHRIPYEHELTAQFGCARMTVNKAIASLVDAGLIVRRRRVGSFVAQPRIHSAVLDIPDIQGEVTARGAVYGLALLYRRRRKPAHNRPGELKLAGGGDLLAVPMLRQAAGCSMPRLREAPKRWVSRAASRSAPRLISSRSIRIFPPSSRAARTI